MPSAKAVRRLPLWLHRLLVPSFVDLFFVTLLLAAFARPGGLEALLADGDTGWHIRTGQLVLATGSVPVTDPFSFTRPGDPWFAWEWLSDTLFALVFGRLGLAGVAALSAVVLALAAAALFCWLLRRESGLWIALALTLAAVSASTVHYLARPHVFSILFYTLTLWLLDEDAGRAGARLWLLAPMCALWANLHAGFVVLPATVLLAAAVSLARSRSGAALRFASVSLACVAASLLNPYGWRLHAHVFAYLNSSWILEHVQEFQSPNIRTEGMLLFAVLLLAAAALASRTMARGRWMEGLLVLVWGFAALRSARHIPLFAVAAAPVVAGEFALWYARRVSLAGPRSLWRAVGELASELGRGRHASLWMAAAAVAMIAGRGLAPESGFPRSHFPVAALEKNQERLLAGAAPRILSSDQWADYLIFRLFPRQRVFFDGRSDFYGPRLGADYRVLQSGTGNWRELLDRYRFDLALLPRSWPLSTVLTREPEWRLLYQDSEAVLVERVPGSNQAARAVAPGVRP